tara:strand:- start:492 stop:1262 length:771 start_codon:yes stop_codon:yes gene_type:complete
MKKFCFIIDKTIRTARLKKIFLKKYNNYTPSKSDIIIVAGGDGFMLRTVKKYYKFNKPFYGINFGTIGFLMNKYHSRDLQKKVKKTKMFVINPLEVKIINLNGNIYKTLAVNEISLLRQSRQTAVLNLKINNKDLIKKLISDGVLVSTPAGSTAYNLSVNGPILTLNSKKLAITPISPFRPRRWKGKVVTDKMKILIKNLDPYKRPVSATADNNETRNVKKLKININKKISFKILFDKSESLIKKIKLEQNKMKLN